MRQVQGRWVVIPVVIFIAVVVVIAAWYLFWGPGSPAHHV